MVSDSNSPMEIDPVGPQTSTENDTIDDRQGCTTASHPPSKRIKLDVTNEGDATSTTLSQSTTLAPSHSNESSVQATDLPSTKAEVSLREQPSAATGSEKMGQQSMGITTTKTEHGGSSIVTNSPGVSNSSGRSTSSSAESLHQPSNLATAPKVPGLSSANPQLAPTAAAPPVNPMVPLKATTMHHLHSKYVAELEYMLLEFRKLERQLLGAKGAAQLEESAGSRERREKLHSFILHLEDTVRQIDEGCKLEDEGKTAIVSGITDSSDAEMDDDAKRKMAESSALANLTTEKEAEENVQKLEEHILANLLPVKVRLKKQLAAQQGASRNPAGMPAPRRGMLQPSAATRGKGTFAAAAEQRIKEAEAARLEAQHQQEQKMLKLSKPSQFGRPLAGGGSSLTRSLHGKTLGSKQRPGGHGVGTPSKPSEDGSSPSNKTILYAGMVPQSSQHQSGVAAATGVHDMVIENPSFLPKPTSPKTHVPDISVPPPPLPVSTQDVPVKPPVMEVDPPVPKAVPVPTPPPSSQPVAATSHTIMPPYTINEDTENSTSLKISEDERRKLRKKRRKRKLLRIARRRERDRQRQLALNQQTQANHLKVAGGRKKAVLGKGIGRKKGPRAVEYICSNCSEAYNSTCDYNPWWALAQHECPKCRKVQIPRIDITSPSNQIEYHPALLAHADDNGASGGVATNVSVLHIPKAATPALPAAYPALSLTKELATPIGSDSESDLSELSDYSLSDCSLDSDDSDLDIPSLTPAERAEHETFGHDYKGPVLSNNHASRLLILMSHASTCPCHHKSTRHRDVCRSTKYMMLHIRDCPGTTSNFDVCPFPWCRKVKHLLYHLVSCTNPSECAICSPKDISKSLQALVGLNKFRAKKHAARLIAQARCMVASGNAQVMGRPNVTVPATKAEPAALKTATTTSTFQRQTNEAAHLKALAHATAKPVPANPYSKATQPNSNKLPSAPATVKTSSQAWKPAGPQPITAANTVTKATLPPVGVQQQAKTNLQPFPGSKMQIPPTTHIPAVPAKPVSIAAAPQIAVSKPPIKPPGASGQTVPPIQATASTPLAKHPPIAPNQAQIQAVAKTLQPTNIKQNIQSSQPSINSSTTPTQKVITTKQPVSATISPSKPVPSLSVQPQTGKLDVKGDDKSQTAVIGEGQTTLPVKTESSVDTVLVTQEHSNSLQSKSKSEIQTQDDSVQASNQSIPPPVAPNSLPVTDGSDGSEQGEPIASPLPESSKTCNTEPGHPPLETIGKAESTGNIVKVGG